MNTFLYTELGSETYVGVMTRLGYEASLRHHLFTLKLPHKPGQMLLVDNGIINFNNYRFVQFCIDSHGYVDLHSSSYVTLDEELRSCCDAVLRAHPESLGTLTASKKYLITAGIKDYKLI